MADDDLTESIVRQHLRDHPGEAQCAACLADLALQPGSTLSRILDDLASAGPRSRPVAAGAGRTG